jgi:hypothetical protein
LTSRWLSFCFSLYLYNLSFDVSALFIPNFLFFDFRVAALLDAGVPSSLC